MNDGGVGWKKSLISSPAINLTVLMIAISKHLHLALLNNICPSFKSYGDHSRNTEMGQEIIRSSKVT